MLLSIEWCPSVLPQRHDVFPTAAGPTPHDGVLHRDVLQRLGEARRVVSTGRHGLQELVVFDADQIFEPDAVPAPGNEVAVRGETVTTQHRCEAGVLVLSGDVDAKLVHLLEVPGDRTLGAVDLEAVLALRPDHRTTGLERAACAAVEDTEHSDVVLVGDLALRVTRVATVVMSAATRRQRPLLDERLTGTAHLGDAADEIVSEVDRVAEDVGAHPMTCLIDEEAP